MADDSTLTGLLAWRADELDTDDPAVGIEVGDERFPASGLVRQLAAVMRLAISKPHVADVLRHDDSLATG
jgi:hypothetical protein